MTTWPYPAPEDCGGARHLTAGHEIPDLALPSTKGGELEISRLPGLAILFIYPWTGAPGRPNPPGWDAIPGAHGSTPEAEGFRDFHSAFIKLGITVVGVSSQSCIEQKEFSDRIGLPFPLLSDEGLLLRQALALPAFVTGGKTYLKRLTLVLRDGAIERTCYPVHPPDQHAAKILEWLIA
jgi:peroxiredoxin